MKKYLNLYPLFILCLIAITDKAQAPVITSSVIPGVGSVIVNEVLDTTGFVLSNPGANQNWNYSALDTLGAYPFYYIAVSQTPNPALFSNADLAIETLTGIEYFNVNASGYSNCGGQSSYPVDYNQPEKLFSLPLTYGDSSRSYFEADVAASDTNPGFVRSGYVTSVVDAYGALTLPNGITYNNVLRVRIIENYQDSLDGSGFYYYLDSLYYWFSPEIAGTMLTYFHFQNVLSTDGFNDTSESYSLYAYQTGVTSIKPISQFSSVKIYPNPTSQYLQVQSAELLEKYNLTDLSGRLICEGNFDNKVSGNIPVANLPEGMYFLECKNTSGQSNIQKVIINR